jgi:peptide/nickel transport system ATP-binding protein
MSLTPARSDPAPSEPLLTVKNLSVRFHMHRLTVDAVRDVSFTLGREKLAIVGESGSGKSTLGRAILGLHPASARVTADRFMFRQTNLLNLPEKEMLKIRGRKISMILQDPKFALNPVMTVGEQIAEAYRLHHRTSAGEARRRAIEMLDAVRIRNPERVYRQYPHQVSGGMGQRVMIAMMLIPEPDLIIADEPTSALDVTVRLQVLAILDDLVSERGIGLIFISHDLNLVRSFCDRVLIMYSGRVVEKIDAARLDEVQHPYSRGLLASLPRIDEPRDRLPVLSRDSAWAREGLV